MTSGDLFTLLCDIKVLVLAKNVRSYNWKQFKCCLLTLILASCLIYSYAFEEYISSFGC